MSKIAYCVITSESAKSFEFVSYEPTKYVFYDCPEAVVTIADSTKGLGAAIASEGTKKRRRQSRGRRRTGEVSLTRGTT